MFDDPYVVGARLKRAKYRDNNVGNAVIANIDQVNGTIVYTVFTDYGNICTYTESEMYGNWQVFGFGSVDEWMKDRAELIKRQQLQYEELTEVL